jgi:hypothetical protein
MSPLPSSTSGTLQLCQTTSAHSVRLYCHVNMGSQAPLSRNWFREIFGLFIMSYKEKLKQKRIKEYYQKKYKQKCIDKIIKKKTHDKITTICNEKRKQKHQINEYLILLRSDVIYKIVSNLATRARMSFDKNKFGLTHREIIGCDPSTLQIHLEGQFMEGMTFNNYGEWEVDHIIPVSYFKLDNINNIKRCFGHNNLQPLWRHDNRTKSNKLPCEIGELATPCLHGNRAERSEQT